MHFAVIFGIFLALGTLSEAETTSGYPFAHCNWNCEGLPTPVCAQDEDGDEFTFTNSCRLELLNCIRYATNQEKWNIIHPGECKEYQCPDGSCEGNSFAPNREKRGVKKARYNRRSFRKSYPQRRRLSSNRRSFISASRIH